VGPAENRETITESSAGFDLLRQRMLNETRVHRR
jgi:hypothetical protein